MIKEVSDYLDYINKLTKENFDDLIRKYRTCEPKDRRHYHYQLLNYFTDWSYYEDNPDKLEAFLEEEKKRRYEKFISSIEAKGGKIKAVDYLTVYDGRLNGEVTCEKGSVRVTTTLVAMYSDLVRPHYRTRVTLLKNK